MKNLLFITDVKVDTIEQKLSGVYAGAKAFGWAVHEVELRNTTRTVDDFIEFWKPDGCIVDYCDTELNRLAPAKFPHVAFVYLDVDERLTPSCVHTVQNDSKTCAEIAFRELERINPASYAFIPWCDPIDWSLRREEVFMDLARSTGRKAASFHGKWSKADVMSAQDAFAGFLAQLPHPCAVMATNDEVADLVLRACPLADLAVPGDVALVSVDNSVRLCENSRPTISSVQADFFEGGRVAVEILENVVCKGAKRRFRLVYAPKEFVRRQSSRRLVVNDPKHCSSSSSEQIRYVRSSRRNVNSRRSPRFWISAAVGGTTLLPRDRHQRAAGNPEPPLRRRDRTPEETQPGHRPHRQPLRLGVGELPQALFPQAHGAVDARLARAAHVTQRARFSRAKGEDAQKAV